MKVFIVLKEETVVEDHAVSTIKAFDTKEKADGYAKYCKDLETMEWDTAMSMFPGLGVDDIASLTLSPVDKREKYQLHIVWNMFRYTAYNVVEMEVE